MNLKEQIAVNTLKKLVLSALLALVLAGPLAACNTMDGLGRDATAAGDALSGAAQKTKGY